MNEELKIIISAEIDKLKTELQKGKKEVEGFGKEGESSFSKFNDGVQKAGEIGKKALAGFAMAAAGAATALIGMAASTKEYREEQAKLSTAFESAGGSAETAKNTYNDLYRVLGDGGQATEAANHLAKLTTGQKELNEWTTICQGVYATFGDSLPIESLTEAANETAKVGTLTGGLADALNWAGVNEEEFQAKLDACNTEAEREALIRETLNGMYSTAAANYEENAAGLLAENEAQLKMNEAMAQLGEVAAPVITMLTQLGAEVLSQLTPYLQEIADKYGPTIKESLSGIGESVGTLMGFIADNWEIISVIGGVILAIATALSIASTALTIYNTVMAVHNAVMMASPTTWIILAIVAAVAALIAIIVLCVKHWDTIKETVSNAMAKIKEAVQKGIDAVVGFFNKIINFVKENWQGLLLLIVNPFAGAFKLAYDNCEGFRKNVNSFVSKVKTGITNGFNAAKNAIVTPIKSAFESVKTTFTNITNTISEKIEAAKTKVKTVIDAIKGFFDFEFKMPKIPTPSFGITPKGWKMSDLLEGSIPKLSIKWNAVGGVFDKPTIFGYGNSLQGIGEDGAEAVVPLEKNTQWLDRIATMLNDKMGGGSPIILQVDGKTFAQISVDSINQLTRQTGSLPLKLA